MNHNAAKLHPKGFLHDSLGSPLASAVTTAFITEGEETCGVSFWCLMNLPLAGDVAIQKLLHNSASAFTTQQETLSLSTPCPPALPAAVAENCAMHTVLG